MLDFPTGKSHLRRTNDFQEVRRQYLEKWGYSHTDVGTVWRRTADIIIRDLLRYY